MTDNNYSKGIVIIDKGMNEVGGFRLPHSPDSDCNSNHHSSISYISNTSSQEIDFIQDNSDYQWFIDYGYKDNISTINNHHHHHHQSILSLPESYEINDINYYDTISKNMDANLAEADMESFRTEDIHELLTNLPPMMCTDLVLQDNNRQGDGYASVTGSLMAKFNDFDDNSCSTPPHHHSSNDNNDNNDDSINSTTSMSICKSELLFSPIKETPPIPSVNFSVDSLDCDNLHDIMLTCQANKDNYTIAFEGSITIYSEDISDDYHYTDKSENSTSGSIHNWPPNNDLTKKQQQQQNNPKILDKSMTQSDSGNLTTWSKLKKLNSDNQLRRHPSGNNNNNNNNNSTDESTQLGLITDNKSQSMPNLYKEKLKNLLLVSTYLKSQTNNSTDESTIKVKPVKVFDIQHQQQQQQQNNSITNMSTSFDASTSDNTNNKANFSLVKLFIKQKSQSTEGMSLTMDQLSSTSENWPIGQSGDSDKIEMKNSETKTNDSSVRTYDLIAEENEDNSESVEQLSESISKLDSIGNCSFDKDNDLFKNINNNNNNNSFHKEKIIKKNKNDLMNRSIQTSQFSEIEHLKKTTISSNNDYKIPYKIIEPSFLSKLKKESEYNTNDKPIYVLYPNYVLPNLDFLEKDNINKILLMPQELPKTSIKKRPFSFNDLEILKKKGFNHIEDWDSLNFLLPKEYKNILVDLPEINKKLIKQKQRPINCDYTLNQSCSSSSQPSSGYRGSSTILNDSQNSPAIITNNLNPLFVYRYDSVSSSEISLINDRHQKIITNTAPPLPLRCVSLPQDDVNNVPPRPPLPKGILRSGKDLLSKRYEINEDDLINEEKLLKKKLIQEPSYYLKRIKKLSETEDEGVDAGTSSSSIDEHNEPLSKDYILNNISNDELIQLEEFLKISGISSDNDELNEENLMQLRSYVGKFLSLKINQDDCGKKNVSFAEKINILPKYLDINNKFIAPNNSPNVSAFQQNNITKTLIDMPICEENENNSPKITPIHHHHHHHHYQNNDLEQKKYLINGVKDAVEKLIEHFSLATNQKELNALGDCSITPSCAKLILSTLCPSLYAILNDNLKPFLESSFGNINNSVWQVVEASAQQGPLTKSLNELVMKINSEDIINNEGLVKFNAFIFGLLNVRSLDAWISYLRTRETILRKHYKKESLLLMANSGANFHSLLDSLIVSLQPLALLPFQLDLLFEYRQLHISFKRMEQLSPTHNKLSTSPNFKQWSKISTNSNSSDEPITVIQYDNDGINKLKKDKERPKSCCIEPTKPNFKLGDVTLTAKKRWSGISVNSKLFLAYDRLSKDDDEEYNDSLENNNGIPSIFKGEHYSKLQEEKENGPESLDSNLSDDKPINGRRFKKLQQKWEMLSGHNSQSPPNSPILLTPNKSRIPRLITSPNNKPSGNIPVPTSPIKSEQSKIAKKILITKPITTIKQPPIKNKGPSTRTSRVDQLENDQPRQIQRPSSLPYKTAPQKYIKTTPPRRAASSSSNRKQYSKTTMPKIVRTLSHRVPSESGHLTYNEGEKLKVVLEVDDKWLLCCRGSQKGLVPKSAVIADVGHF